MRGCSVAHVLSLRPRLARQGPGAWLWDARRSERRRAFPLLHLPLMTCCLLCCVLWLASSHHQLPNTYSCPGEGSASDSDSSDMRTCLAAKVISVTLPFITTASKADLQIRSAHARRPTEVQESRHRAWGVCLYSYSAQVCT